MKGFVKVGKVGKDMKCITYHIRNAKDFASDCGPPYHQIRIKCDPQYASNKGNVKEFLFCNKKRLNTHEFQNGIKNVLFSFLVSGSVIKRGPMIGKEMI